MGAKVGVLRSRKSASGARPVSSASFGALAKRKEYKTGAQLIAEKNKAGKRRL